MDKEIKKVHPTPTDAPARAPKTNKLPPPVLADARSKPRIRSYSSTLINLGALIALFAVVFALQHVSNRDSDDRGGGSEPPEAVATTDETPAIDSTTKTASGARATATFPEREAAVVDLETLETCRQLQAAGHLKAASDGGAAGATRKGHQSKRTRTYGRQTGGRDIAWEDRRRSAELVDMLDGGYGRRRSTTYASTPATAPRGGYEPAPSNEPYRSDLDDEAARQHYLSTNVQPREGYAARDTDYTSTSYSSAYDESDSREMQVAQTSRGGRKPLWEANVGQ